MHFDGARLLAGSRERPAEAAPTESDDADDDKQFDQRERRLRFSMCSHELSPWKVVPPFSDWRATFVPQRIGSPRRSIIR